MTIQMDPDTLAAALGVTITTHTGSPDKGRYYGNGLISLRSDLGPINRRCTLAHELAHHTLGHRPDAQGWWCDRQENEADKWAANLLISPAEYAAAELLHGPHLGAIASELQVTRHLANTWRIHHEKRKAA